MSNTTINGRYRTAYPWTVDDIKDTTMTDAEKAARVKEWNATTNKLEISGISSNFHNGEQIIGQNSGAKFAIFSVNTDDEVSGFAENDVIQSEADAVLDFTETNPFGMP